MTATTDGYRLSPRQRQLWRAHQQGVPMQTVVLAELAGPVDPPRLRHALEAVARRHEMLRISFRTVPGMRVPLQVAVDEPRLYWQVVDPPGPPAETADRLWAQALERPFGIDDEPPVAATLIYTGDGGALLLLGMSALAVDAHSVHTVLAEIGRAYAGDHLDEAPSYIQYSEWQHDLLSNGIDKRGTSYWQRLGASATPRPALPLEGPAPAGAPGVISRILPEPVAQAVAALAAANAVTTGEVVLAAWGTLLARLTGATRLTVAGVLDARHHEELRETVGHFARPAPTTLDILPDTGFDDVLSQVRHAGTEHEPWTDMLGDPGAQGDIALGFVHTGAPWDAGTTLGLRRLHLGGVAHELALIQHSGPPPSLELRHPASLSAEAAEILLDQVAEVLTAVCADPRLRPSALAITTPGEMRRMDAANDTDVAGTRETPLHVLFSRQAADTPHAPAAACGDVVVDYADLDRRTNRLAAVLRARGIGCGSVCAVRIEPGVAVLEALLGILKSGAAYLPIDPAWPAQRVSAILHDAQAGLVLTGDDAQHDAGLPVLSLDREAPAIAAALDGSVDAAVVPEDLAAIIYTSGSTGVPKGVCVTHGGLANYLTWARQAYPLAEGNGSLVHSSVGYDLTVTALFAPLLAGQCVRFTTPAGLEGLARVIEEHNDFGVLKVTPTHLRLLHRMLPGQRTAGLARCLVIGGEHLTEAMLAPWRAAQPGLRAFNEYGPTETVVGCCVHEATEAGVGDSVPIGRPIANTRLYVLDAAMRRVPLGLRGELYIGGAGVARGYHGRPDLTADRFVPDAFSGRPGERLYRTGDLVRYRADGTLEFLGRIDDQQQVNGFRVEPAEIEATLASYPAVQDAAVGVQHLADGGSRIVACVVPTGGTTIDLEALRAHLRERLPDHMVPALIAPVAVLPLTPGGKVDRPAVVERAAKERRTERPAAGRSRTDAEQVVARIWEETLGYDGIGVDDSFFDLGGDSFLLLDAAVRLQEEFGVEVTPLMLLEHPTIASVAAMLTERAASSATAEEEPETTEPAAVTAHARRQRDAVDKARLRRSGRQEP